MDPYSIITKENFDIIKSVLQWGIENQKTPVEITKRLSHDANISIPMARALVQEELIGAMGFMKDGHSTS